MANLSIHSTAKLSVLFRKKSLSRHLTFYFCLCIITASSIFLHDLRVRTGLLPLTNCPVEFSSKVREKISIIGVKKSLIGVNYRSAIGKVVQVEQKDIKVEFSYFQQANLVRHICIYS